MELGSNDVFTAAHLFEPQRLTVARELRGISRSELAEKIEKSPSAVSQFESGRARPDGQTLSRIALGLGIPAAFFARPLGQILSLDACHFRSLRSASQRDRRRLLAWALAPSGLRVGSSLVLVPRCFGFRIIAHRRIGVTLGILPP